MDSERIECLTEIFEEAGVSATEEQIKRISEDYAFHLDMEREMSSYQHIGGSNECEECQSLHIKVKEKENEITKYQNSVKRRRNADSVWLDGEDVRYE